MADVTKIAGYVRVRILMNRLFFRIFGIHIFLTYGEFFELINMHAMKLRVQALRAALASGARRALPLVGGAL